MGRRTPTGNWNGKCCWSLFDQGGGTPPVPAPAFHAATMDPATGEMLPVAIGDGPMTVGRDTDIWLPDYEGIYRQFGAGEVGWQGGRAVTNWARNSGDLTAEGWTASGSSTVDGPDLWTSSALGERVYNVGLHSVAIGERICISAELSIVSGDLAAEFRFDQNGPSTNPLLILTNTPTRYCSVWDATQGNAFSRLTRRDSLSTPVQVRITDWQYEVLQPGETIPGERIASGDATPGVAVYGTTNGNTVDGNEVVTEARGIDLPEMPWIVSAPQATDYFLNSQAPVTQTISGFAAVAHTCWLEGAGTATLSGGATGVVSDGNPMTFTPTGDVTVTIAGGPPDFVQVENNAAPSPPIFTEGAAVSRSADINTVPTSNHDETNAAIYCEMVSGLGSALTSTDNDLIVGNPAVNTQRCLRRTRHALASATTGTTAESITGDMDNGHINKVGLVYDNATGKMQVCVNGTWGVEVTDYVGVPIDVYQILGNIEGVAATNKIRDLREYRGTYEALTAVIDGLMA